MRTVRLSLMFWAAAALAQFPFPGQSPYPGGNPYPTGPGGPRYPQQQQPQQQQPQNSGRRSDRPDHAVTSSTDGMVRRVSGNQLVIESDDHRVIWYRITAQTTAHKNDRTVDVGTFPPGDRISVESSEDDQGNLTATDVSWARAGTAGEKAAAQQTWDLPGVASSMSPAGASSGRTDSSPGDDDSDRPILRRSHSEDATAVPASPTAGPGGPVPPTAEAQNSPGTAGPAPAPVAADENAPPATQLQPPPPPLDPDDPGPPVLHHGRPETAHQPVSTGSLAPPPAPAPAAPSRKPSESDGGPVLVGRVSEIPSRPPEPRPTLPQEDPLIPKVRQAAYTFSASLPNFFCQQITTRYRTEDLKQGWDTIDIVTADLAYENGQESYRNIKVGNHSTVKSMDELGGTRSTGEFSSMLQDLMSEATGATFRRNGTDTIRGRSAIVFKLDVPRERSHWRIEAPSELYYPAYTGSIWVDRETSRVLRIEMQARNLPALFPFDTVESATDYDFMRLTAGGEEYLLPANAEVLSCERGTSFCSRNRIEFHNYRKFDAATSISFDGK